MATPTVRPQDVDLSPLSSERKDGKSKKDEKSETMPLLDFRLGYGSSSIECSLRPRSGESSANINNDIALGRFKGISDDLIINIIRFLKPSEFLSFALSRKSIYTILCPHLSEYHLELMCTVMARWMRELPLFSPEIHEAAENVRRSSFLTTFGKIFFIACIITGGLIISSCIAEDYDLALRALCALSFEAAVLIGRAILNCIREGRTCYDTPPLIYTISRTGFCTSVISASLRSELDAALKDLDVYKKKAASRKKSAIGNCFSFFFRSTSPRAESTLYSATCNSSNAVIFDLIELRDILEKEMPAIVAMAVKAHRIEAAKIFLNLAKSFFQQENQNIKDIVKYYTKLIAIIEKSLKQLETIKTDAHKIHAIATPMSSGSAPSGVSSALDLSSTSSEAPASAGAMFSGIGVSQVWKIFHPERRLPQDYRDDPFSPRCPSPVNSSSCTQSSGIYCSGQPSLSLESVSSAAAECAGSSDSVYVTLAPS